MLVIHDGRLLHRWPVSTARDGKITQNGTFAPEVFVRQHYSRLYDGAPMPWSIFYSGHYAIHGTDHNDKRGSVASAGCVPLQPDNAEILYNLTRETGLGNTRIVIQD